MCLLGSAGIAVLDACSPSTANAISKPVVKNNRVQVPLSLFDEKALQIISPAKYEYEIAVEKTSANTYRALLLKCTHYENQLTSTGNGFVCFAHGSRFNKEGKVLNGPAALDLISLKTEIIQSNLYISLNT